MRKLDTYYGRNLLAIEGTDEQWHLLLDGGVIIRNNDPDIPMPNVPLNTTFEEANLEDDPHELIFRGKQLTSNEMTLMHEGAVTLNSNKYSIFDKLTANEEFNPSKRINEPQVVPTEDTKRVVYGPQYPSAIVIEEEVAVDG